MNKKILFVLHLPPPIHGAAMVGKYIYDSRWINNHFDCLFVNLSASVRVEEVGKLSLRKVFFLFTNLWQVFRTVLKERPQLCYLTPTSNMGPAFLRDFVLVKILHLFQVKVVLHFHNKASKNSTRNLVYRILCKSFFRRVEIILLGQELYQEKSAYIKRERVHFCPNGIPSVESIDRIFRRSTGPVRFLFLSNMMKEKGVGILLEACRILKQKNYHFRCDFVGGWKDISHEWFNILRSRYHLMDEVKAHGAKYGIEKAAFFEEADVFVFPTYYHNEAFPLVLLEAMDYSLPCISTYNGAIASLIVDGETGFCVEQLKVDDLADKMIWMIEHPEERMKMGMTGKRRFDEKFTLEQFEKNMGSILSRCL